MTIRAGGIILYRTKMTEKSMKTDGIILYKTNRREGIRKDHVVRQEILQQD
jgi:hypothetical protein